MYLASIHGLEYNHFWPWNLDSAFVALPFYAIGHQLTVNVGHSRLITYSQANKWKVFILCSLLTVVLYYLAVKFGAISMGHSQFGNEYVFHIRALIGCASTLLFSLWLASVGSNILRPVVRYVTWFGKNSFDVMATNNPLKGVFCTIIAMALHVKVNDASFTDIEHSMMAFIPTMIADTIIVYYILKFKILWKTITK